MRIAHAIAIALTIVVLPLSSPAYAAPDDSADDGGTAAIVDRTRSDGRVLALTFDDGPSEEWTPRLLELFRRYQVRATFCLLGSQAQQHPALVRRIVADGHAVCNHTWKHDAPSGMTVEQIRADLTATNEAIRAATGNAALPIRYFRAPFAAWGDAPMVAAEMGMTSLGWAVDPTDWDGSPADVLLQRLREQLRRTAVVLSHDGGGDRAATVDAYRTLVPQLRRERWRFDLPATTGIQQPACTAPAWRRGTRYAAGDRVSRSGKVFQAIRRTLAQDPVVARRAWADLGDC